MRVRSHLCVVRSSRLFVRDHLLNSCSEYAGTTTACSHYLTLSLSRKFSEVRLVWCLANAWRCLRHGLSRGKCVAIAGGHHGQLTMLFSTHRQLHQPRLASGLEYYIFVSQTFARVSDERSRYTPNRGADVNSASGLVSSIERET
jgi:hypothetical protein